MRKIRKNIFQKFFSAEKFHAEIRFCNTSMRHFCQALRKISEKLVGFLLDFIITIIFTVENFSTFKEIFIKRNENIISKRI